MKSPYFRVILEDATTGGLVDKFFVKNLRDVTSVLKRYELHNIIVKFFIVEDE